MVIPLLRPDRPLHWVLDWDGTITKRDTLDTLVNIAAQRKPNFHVPEKWAVVTKAYLNDYERTLQEQQDGKLPSTVTEEKTLLKILEQVEQRSIDRVSESGNFKDLTRDDLDQGAEKAVNSGQVQIREGYAEFSRHVQSQHNQKDEGSASFDILSVNWSRRFIHACLKAAHVGVHESAIHSNELEGISSGRPPTGHISPGGMSKIISSRDKLHCLQNMRRKSPQTGDRRPTVYVGDSWTDFECLLEADLGICIRDEPMTSTQQKLADSFNRLGIRCSRLQDTKEQDEWGVVWARGFHEVLHWLRTGP